MEMIHQFQHLPCRHCQGKNHCADCGEDIRHSLLELPGVTDAQVNMKESQIRVQGSIHRDDLLDALEGMGIFAD